MKTKKKIIITILSGALAFVGCFASLGLFTNVAIANNGNFVSSFLDDDTVENSPFKDVLKGISNSLDVFLTNDESGDSLNLTSYNSNEYTSSTITDKDKGVDIQNRIYNDIKNSPLGKEDLTNYNLVKDASGKVKTKDQEYNSRGTEHESNSGYVYDVEYPDASGFIHKCPCAKVMTGDIIDLGNDSTCDNWYIVNQNLNHNGYGLVCHGNVKFIVSKDVTYEHEADHSGDNKAAIGVTGPNSFKLFGEGTLKLKGDNGTSDAACIGGGADEDGCNIEINGCTILCNIGRFSTDSACIGGGEGGEGYNIVLNNCLLGNIVTTLANPSQQNGSIIGGGQGRAGHSIIINWFRVYNDDRRNLGNDEGDAAVIGGGDQGDGYDIIINNMKYDDRLPWFCLGEADNDGAFIGGGKAGKGYNLFINGGYIHIKGGDENTGAIIGGGEEKEGYNIFINGGDLSFVNDDSQAALIGGGEEAAGHDININGGKIDCHIEDDGACIGGGRTKDGYNIYIRGGNLDLHAEYKNLFGAGADSACIGGGYNGVGHDIYISGGSINAVGCDGCAAIGGSHQCAGYNIKISGGTITARGGDDAAGIGGGTDVYVSQDVKISDVTISGGTVKAYGGDGLCGGGAGIGAGNEDSAKVTIYGGNIEAHGGNGTGGGGAGIGGGEDGNGTVDIYGGNIKAYGGGSAAGIGGGYDDDKNSDSRSAIYIHAPANIYAERGPRCDEDGMAIGRGDDGNPPAIWVYPGLNISKYNGSSWSNVDYSVKYNKDNASENLVNQLGDAKKIKIDTFIQIDKVEQVDVAYKHLGKGVNTYKAHVTNFGGILNDNDYAEFLSSFRLDCDNGLKNCKFEHLKLEGDMLSFVIVYDSNEVSCGNNPFTIEYTQNNEKYSFPANLFVSQKTVTPDMVKHITDQTVQSDSNEVQPLVKDGSYTLVCGKDYNLRYEHNKGIGVGKVYVDGIGDYSGTVEVEFNIVPKGNGERTRVYYDENGNENFADAIPYYYNYSTLANDWYYVYGDVDVDKPISLSGDVHIILIDGANLNFNCGDNYPFILSDDNAKITLHHQYLHTGMVNTERRHTQLNDGNINGLQNVIYCNSHFDSNINASTIKKDNVKFIAMNSSSYLAVDDLEFCSNHFNYSINLDKNKSALKPGSNLYKILIEYDSSVIEVQNNLTISKTDITTCQVSCIDNATYTGSPICPLPIITFGDYTLEKNLDYKLSWSNNVNVGTATIHIEGDNNFKGSLDINFEILPSLCNIKQQENAYLSINSSVDFTAQSTFDPKSIKDIKFNWINNNGAEFKVENLLYGVGYMNYTIYVDNNLVVGDNPYMITINYGDAKYVTTSNLVVKKYEITSDMVSPIKDYKFAKKYIEPKLSINFEDYQLIEGLDYNVTYSNNFYPGYANVHIEGLDSFKGSNVDVKFRITPDQTIQTKENISYSSNNKSIVAQALKIFDTTASLFAADYNPNTEIWYYVDKDTVIDSPLTVYGNVHVILCDGATLKVNPTNAEPFNIKGASKLTFHYQTAHTGNLDVGIHKLPSTVMFAK